MTADISDDSPGIKYEYGNNDKKIEIDNMRKTDTGDSMWKTWLLLIHLMVSICQGYRIAGFER